MVTTPIKIDVLAFQDTLDNHDLFFCFSTQQDLDQRRYIETLLRQKVFAYLQGTLKNKQGGLVPRGPAATALFSSLNDDKVTVLDEIKYFVQKQSQDGQYATELELILLAEMLDVNLIIQYASTGKSTLFHSSTLPDRPVITIENTANCLWDAVIFGKKSTTTDHGAGNCAYDAFREAACAYLPSQKINNKTTNVLFENKAVEESRKLEAFYEQVIQKKYNYKNDQEIFKASQERLKQEDPAKYNEVQKQIQADYKFAVTILINDLKEATFSAENFSPSITLN